MQRLDDLHVQVEVVHGHVIIFRHHQIKSHETRIGLRQLKSEQDLRKHLLPRQSAQHLIQIMNRNLASRSRLRRPAMQHLFLSSFIGIKLAAHRRDHIRHSAGQ